MKFLNTLYAGLSLALARRLRPERLALAPGQFWGLAAIAIGLSFCFSYLTAEPPRALAPDALQTESFGIVLLLLLGFLLAQATRRPELCWQLPVLLASAGIFVALANRLVYGWILPAWDAEQHAYAFYYGFTLLWWALIMQRALTALAPAQAACKRSALAIGAVALSALPGHVLHYQEFWETDYQAIAQQAAKARQPPLNAEEVLYRQRELLTHALEQVAVGRAGVPELYFVAFGSYGPQNVFMNEVLYTQGMFKERFGAAAHTLVLVNNRALADTLPLASVTNLRTALQALAGRMNPEEDILFLFLTSHGSQEHRLVVELEQLPLQDLAADKLAELLNETPLQWKVIVVSACYSGG